MPTPQQREAQFEAVIAAKTAALGASLVAGLPSALPEMTEAQIIRVASLSEIVARLRPVVQRSRKDEIVEVPGCEEPGRIHKGLSLIAKGHAAMWKRREVEEDDMRVAARVARDSIPLRRLNLLMHMEKTVPIKTGVLATKANNTPESSVRWNMDELKALRVVKSFSDGASEHVFWEFKRNFLALNEAAGFEGVLR